MFSPLIYLRFEGSQILCSCELQILFLSPFSLFFIFFSSPSLVLFVASQIHKEAKDSRNCIWKAPTKYHKSCYVISKKLQWQLHWVILNLFQSVLDL